MNFNRNKLSTWRVVSGLCSFLYKKRIASALLKKRVCFPVQIPPHQCNSDGDDNWTLILIPREYPLMGKHETIVIIPPGIYRIKKDKDKIIFLE